MERGVDADDDRRPGQDLAECCEHRDRGRVVQRSEIGQRRESRQQRVVDQGRRADDIAAVDEPHGCRLDRRCLGDETSERLDVEGPVGGVFVCDQCPVVLVDDGELDTARARIDGEHVHEIPSDQRHSVDLGRIGAVFTDVGARSMDPLRVLLDEPATDAGVSRRALQRPDREVVPTDSVVDQELERRLGGPFLDVAADVEPARGRSVVNELVNRGGVAVEEEDDGPVLGEQRGELLGAQTVRMLVGRFERRAGRRR